MANFSECISLLIFERDGCPPCRSMKPIYQKFLESHPEISPYFFEEKKHPEIFRYFGVENVPAFVYRKDNKNVLKCQGQITEAEMLQIYEEKIKGA